MHVRRDGIKELRGEQLQTATGEAYRPPKPRRKFASRWKLTYGSTMVPILLAALLLQAPAPRPSAPYSTPLTLAEMTNKQAVVNTTAGTFVIDLRPDLAPNHVGYFIKLAREGAYNGTTFHRVIKLGIVQGGDPLSKDPAKAKLYGTGGLGVLKRRAERREDDAGRGGGGAAARDAGQRRRRSSSSASPTSRRSTASTRCSAACPKAWTSCRRSPRRRRTPRACRPSAS